jgi:hypothetical protein
MRTKDASDADACRELCENHERENLLMMSMRFCGKQKNLRQLSIHFITISYHVSNLFAIFQFRGKFNEKSAWKNSENSINLSFVSEIHFVIAESKKVEIDCNDEKSMGIKNSFVLFLNRENFIFIVSILKGTFLSSSASAIETALIMEIKCETEKREL